MFRSWASIVGALLLVIHVGLGVWAAIGWVELAAANIPWTRISNPFFSPTMLAWQWLLVTSASLVFVIGYIRRWRYFPKTIALIYAVMALTCAYQTLFILTHPSRFREMAIEYTEYALILAFLFGSREMRARFSERP